MSVRVVARIRPLLEHELEKETIVRAESSQEGKPHNVVRIPNPRNESEEFSFTFNSVYDTETSQEELFTNEVAPQLKALFQGVDINVFAYGVSGSGKSHTMRGGLKLADRGIIPRLLSSVYRRKKKVAVGQTTVGVSISYYEIYNDKIYDLFEPPEKRSLAGLPLRENNGKTVVVGLSEHACDDLKMFEKLYIEANNNRSTAGTKLNAQSSRSHAILTVKLTQTTGDETLISTASAIDLAGSEDNRRTENNKERMVESASINKSLFVLSSCIDAIGRGDRRIPFRESRMTRVLALGKKDGITIMVLNLAPLRSYHLDTLSSLNISSRAKRIEVREIENEVVFTQPPRKQNGPVTGLSMQRQPLRPLANAHNTHPSQVAQKGDKPAKAFSVYTDKRSGPRSSGAEPQMMRRTASINKRQSDSSHASRPSKMARPNPPVAGATVGLSSTKIEELIERKVQEALAHRALNQAAPPVKNDLTDAVQRRLEALERKIESGEAEEARAEGLRFLLMAKQHKEQGEDRSALKMYELAVPFFPGQEKLQRKIENLRNKIQARKEEAPVELENRRHLATASIIQLPSPPASFEATPLKPEPRARKAAQSTEADDSFNGSAFAPHDENDEDDSFAYHKISKPSRKTNKSSKLEAKSTLRIFTDEPSNHSAPTPRTRHLLDIVNSRDVAMIKGLSGVGAKKARDLVEFLELQNEDEEGGNVRSLQELYGVPGLGRKTVERAYEGVRALLV